MFGLALLPTAPIIFAGESFPRPVFRWLEDEKPREANRTEVAAGKYSGGEVVTSIVEFRAQPEHNGKVYQCFAHNPTFFDKMQPEELNVTIRLEVLCKYFSPCILLTPFYLESYH